MVNLSQGKLGEDNAALLGAMIITKVQQAAMQRVNIPEDQRKDFYLYVDEFQNFATTSFIKILSEARKYKLSLCVANQYIAQIDEEVKKAIFGNIGTMMSFVVGADDANILEKEFGQSFTASNMVSLDKHQIALKLTIDNQMSMPFLAYTLPPAASKNQNRPKVIKVSRERYAYKKAAMPTPKPPEEKEPTPAPAPTTEQKKTPQPTPKVAKTPPQKKPYRKFPFKKGPRPGGGQQKKRTPHRKPHQKK